MRTFFQKLCVCSVSLMLSGNVFAEVVVIVHPTNESKLDTKTISNIYLGKIKRFSMGDIVTPVDLTPGSATRIEFLEKVVSKNERQWKSYWSRLIFTGKGIPPKMFASDAEIRAQVASNTSAIGFISADSLDSSVKSVASY